MSTQHTPGPWRVGEMIHNGRIEIRSINNWYVAQAISGLPIPEIESNARLIAAAPELLAAAKSALHEMCHTTAPRNSFTDAVDQLDAAIAKAEERS